MFAQSLLNFFLSDGVLFVVRIIATVGGAVVGWFVCDPVTRVAYRLSFKGAAPMSILFGTKASGAATAALLIWFFMPLGGGGGGFGWGPGLGGGPGKGAGPGGDKVVANGGSKDAKDAKSKGEPKTTPQREPIKIEILGGNRIKGEDRYYLLKLTDGDSVRSLAEVETYVKEHPPKLIEIIHTDDTAFDNTEESPTRKLRKLATQYEIPTQGPKE